MPTPPKSLELFAACAPGLETLLADEVAALSTDIDGEVAAVAGGVTFRGPQRALYRANLELGLALKVMVRLARFRATDFARLERGAAAIDWAAWLPAGAVVRVRASCTKSRLYHSGAVVERVQRAIAAAVDLGEPAGQPNREAAPAADAAPDTNARPPFEVHARLVRDECTLSLDTSGTSLHKRGYRLETGKAPLREDLARALVLVSGWDGTTPLVDPFCGSGTIAIEAGLVARNAAPGRARAFAFFDAPGFDEQLWNRVRGEAAERERDAAPTLWASDRDAGTIDATRRNAERAGIAVQADVAPLSAAPAWSEIDGEPCTVVTNPPFGARVARGRDLLPLYQTLARLVAERPAARLALVSPDDALVRRARLRATRHLTTDHGGKKIGLYGPRPGTTEPS